MERVEHESQLHLLRRANRELESFFEHYSGKPVGGTQEELKALLQVEGALLAVGATLAGSVGNTVADELREALAGYRSNLLRLQRELAMLQTSATGCRARVFMRQKHLDAARAWCDGARAVR